VNWASPTPYINSDRAWACAQPVLGDSKTPAWLRRGKQLRGLAAGGPPSVARARLLDVAAEQPAPTLVCRWIRARKLFNADAGPKAARFLNLGGPGRTRGGGDPGDVVAVTIRADATSRCRSHPELAGVQARGVRRLKPMPPAGYTEVITGPARRANAAGRRLTVEAALVAAAADGGRREARMALPLLALTLERLYRDFGERGDDDRGRVRVDGRDDPGGADRGRHPARRRT
jgi:hypothetical protein